MFTKVFRKLQRFVLQNPKFDDYKYNVWDELIWNWILPCRMSYRTKMLFSYSIMYSQ